VIVTQVGSLRRAVRGERRHGVFAAAALAAAAVALLLSGCGSSGGGEPSPERGGTLVDAEYQAPPILNVLLADGATVTGQRIVSNILQNLLTVNEKGEYVPQLAEAVPSGTDVREGPLRVTFRLRPEARWSDGEPVTTADVAFTLRTMMDEHNQIASRAGWDQIARIEPGRTAAGGTCAAATCFTVAFRGDYAPWRDVFSVSGGYYVLPRHVLRGKDFNTVWNDGGIVGSGPFTLASYQPRVRAELARSPRYWGSKDAGGGPFLDRIVVNFLDSPGGAVNALRQGEAQMASLPPEPDLIARADAIDGIEVQAAPSVYFEHIILNLQAEPLTDPAVRRALAYAIDRQQVVQVLLASSFPVLQSVLKPFQLGYVPAFEGYTYDPRRARSLLTAAGWTLGADGIFEKDGRGLEIPIVITAGDELRRTTVRLMADQAARAGIRLTARSETPDTIFGGALVQGDFTAAELAFGSGLEPSLTTLLATDQIPTEGNGFTGQNVYRWSDLDADRLMRLADRTVDDAARARALAQVQEIVADQVPLIPLYQQPNAVAHTEALSGVRENPSQAEVFWNSAEWSLGGGSDSP
jgi:peptide/nickel transport system substrate-binding protein